MFDDVRYAGVICNVIIDHVVGNAGFLNIGLLFKKIIVL